MLTSGEVAGLYAPDEKAQVTDCCRDEVGAAGLPTTNDNLWAAFVERVRKVTHSSASRVRVRVSLRRARAQGAARPNPKPNPSPNHTPSPTPNQALHIVVCCSPVGESFRNYVR
eukprot:scaffold127704_cov42-Phaeocystis_antarctica.AAC.1